MIKIIDSSHLKIWKDNISEFILTKYQSTQIFITLGTWIVKFIRRPQSLLNFGTCNRFAAIFNSTQTNVTPFYFRETNPQLFLSRQNETRICIGKKMVALLRFPPPSALFYPLSTSVCISTISAATTSLVIAAIPCTNHPLSLSLSVLLLCLVFLWHAFLFCSTSCLHVNL